MSDPFKNLSLNYQRIDWLDESVDPKFVTKTLIGSVSYWKDRIYTGRNMAPQDIEKEILFNAGPHAWGGVSKHGKPYYQHLLALIKILMPKTDITPNIADTAMFFCTGMSHGVKLLNLIGCRNSGKSAGGVRIAFATLYVDPEYTAWYVANPFDNAADSTVWGEIEDVWMDICEAFPTEKQDVPSVFPKAVKYANRYIEVIKDIPKAARIELRNVKHVGKYKGTKSRKDENNKVRGILGMLLDEVNEIDNMAFLNVLSNITSQKNFFGITSQNFKDIEDMGGTLAQPSAREGGPGRYDDLDLERDIYWLSNVSSVTLRYDGLKSPNVTSGREIYEYLFSNTDIEMLKEDYGDQSPEWYSQCRSFPIRGAEANSVLSQAKISGSRYDDTIFAIDSIQGTVAFCDPSFGGKDKALYGSGRFGVATVTDGQGRQETTDILLFTEHFRAIPLVKDATFDSEWSKRIQALGISMAGIELGALISYEDQISIACAEHMRREGIPAANFGYDFSMRPDIVSSVNRFIGFEAQSFDYTEKPEGYYLQGLKKDTEECCYNKVDELAFLTADLFVSRQVRGGAHIRLATTQLSRTRYESKNGKYKVERKTDYKARWQNVSPDDRDTLMGIVGMAHKRGFRAKAGRSPNGVTGTWSLIANAGKFKNARGRRI